MHQTKPVFEERLAKINFEQDIFDVHSADAIFRNFELVVQFNELLLPQYYCYTFAFFKTKSPKIVDLDMRVCGFQASQDLMI